MLPGHKLYACAINKARWPSGLRRQTKVCIHVGCLRNNLVRKGAGSNPAFVNSFLN